MRRRPTTPLVTDQIPDDRHDPHGDTIGRETEARLTAGVQRLPGLQRDVFLLRAQQGLAYEDIAQALGTTAGAARVHYHHAVKRLKEWLEAGP